MASEIKSTNPAVTPNNKAIWLPWVVCLSASLFFFYQFVQMNMFDAISSNLMATFNISGSQLSDLSSISLYANMLMLYPAGILLDHLSTKKIILIAMGMCVGCTFLFAMAPNFAIASGIRFLTGSGNAFSFLSCMILAARWFPAKRLALITGLMVTIAMVGGAIAHTPLELLTQALGWRHAMIVNGLIGVLLLLVIWWFVQDTPKGHAHHLDQARPPFSLNSFIHQIRLSIKNPQNWKSGLFISALNMPLMVLGALWGSLYLRQVDGFTATQATMISSMIYIGTIVGSPLFGAWSDKIGRRKIPMVIGALLSLITFIFIMFTHFISFDLALFSFFALGFFTSAQIIGYPVITESNPLSTAGTSLGMGSILIMGGAGVCQQLFGYLIDFFWDHKVVNHVPFYSNGDYQISLMIFPLILLLGLVMALLSKETHCVHHQSEE